MIDAVMALEGNFHLLVMDDGSPDGTADIVRERMDQYGPYIFLIEREKKMGLGTAYIYGFKWGLERDYQYFFEMDADFSHPPKDLLRLHEACEKDSADVAIGSRYVEGGGVINWPKDRLFLSKGASLYTRLVTGCRSRIRLQDLFVTNVPFWKTLISIKFVSLVMHSRSG
jgi:dolichol-phosphate mannosyltransferase